MLLGHAPSRDPSVTSRGTTMPPSGLVELVAAPSLTLQPIRERTDCSTCSQVYNLSCVLDERAGIDPKRPRAFRTLSSYEASHPFHRIVNCLLPFWMEIADMAARGDRVCLIGDTDFVGLGDYLSALLPAARSKLYVVDAQLNCTGLWQLGAVRASSLELAVPIPPRRLAAATWTHLRAHVLTATQDVVSIRRGGSPSRFATALPEAVPMDHVVLISREAVGGADKPTERALDREHAQRLALHIATVTGRRVLIYGGRRYSADETIRAFAKAAAVVGFHGAGFANIAFSTRRLCVTEISTLMRDDLATKRLCSDDPELEAERGEKWSDVFGPWRSNREVL